MADGMAEEKEGEIGSEAARDTKRDWTYENKLTQGYYHTWEYIEEEEKKKGIVVMKIGFYFWSSACIYKNNSNFKKINYFSEEKPRSWPNPYLEAKRSKSVIIHLTSLAMLDFTPVSRWRVTVSDQSVASRP